MVKEKSFAQKIAGTTNRSPSQDIINHFRRDAVTDKFVCKLRPISEFVKLSRNLILVTIFVDIRNPSIAEYSAKAIFQYRIFNKDCLIIISRAHGFCKALVHGFVDFVLFHVLLHIFLLIAFTTTILLRQKIAGAAKLPVMFIKNGAILMSKHNILSSQFSNAQISSK